MGRESRSTCTCSPTAGGGGAYSYLTKPLDVRQVLAVLDQLVRDAQPQGTSVG
jgi:DNA-binding response OmpR family regulator